MYHSMKIAGLDRNLPLCPLNEKLQIGAFVMFGDAELTVACAEELLKKADIICEAFDDVECKAMLVNLVLEKMPEKYLVAASGMAGFGSANTIQTRRISKRFYICGDGTSDVQSEGSLVATRVMLCAAHQAHTVLRILTEQFET